MKNSRDLKDLNPCLSRGAEELIKRLIKLGYKPLITQTYRDYEYQNSLYAQGRTRTGNIVTNCKGGQSPHNFGLAFDICQNIKGQEYSNTEFFKVAGQLWSEMGGKWGGTFKSFVDTPHFEFLNGLSMAGLRAGKSLAKNQIMKWEVEEVKPENVKIKINNESCDMKGFDFDGEKYVNLTDFCKVLEFGRGWDNANQISTVTTKK